MTRFRDEMVTMTEEIFDRTRGRKRSKKIPLWAENVKEALREKNKAFRRRFQDKREVTEKGNRLNKKVNSFKGREEDKVIKIITML